MTSSPPRFEARILTPDACLKQLHDGSLPRPLVFTNGVFDILHRGHVSYLDAAAQLGASLIVALNTDDSVRRLNKGADRPFNPLEDRQAVVAALASVSAVTSFADDTPQALIARLRPDIIVKGGDYDMRLLPETALVESWGGRAVSIPLTPGRSTSALASLIRNARPN